MKDLKTIYDKVEHIVLTDKRALNDDLYLISKVLNLYGIDGKTSIDSLVKLQGSFPSFSTITRSRRKVMELHHIPNNSVRNNLEQEYKEFYSDDSNFK